MSRAHRTSTDTNESSKVVPASSARFADEADLFHSAKCKDPIPFRHRLTGYWLAQASLDPCIDSIAYVPLTPSDSELAELVTTVREGRAHFLDIVEARPTLTARQVGFRSMVIADRGLRPLVVTASDILREPRFGNVIEAWRYADRVVPIGVRLQVLNALAEQSPLPLIELLASVRSNVDPAPCVMALACADLVEIDLNCSPIGPSTPVRSRR